MVRAGLVIAGIAMLPASAAAQFEIDVRADAGGETRLFRDVLEFTLFPRIEVREGGFPTGAFVTFISPNGLFYGYVNHPDRVATGSRVMAGTREILDEANGTWMVLIDDGATIHEYEAEVTFTPPFVDLPFFESDTLVGGMPAGRFTWSLNGGSAAYPGPGSQLYTLLQTRSRVDIDEAFLPPSETMWTPEGDLSVADEFFGHLRTVDEAVDGNSFAIGAIRALTPGAPGLSFADTTIVYRAGHSALLVRPATCPADLDGDGELTIFDFLEFQNLFDAMDPLADFDGDGDFTIFDFLAFQNAFDAGCG